MTNRWLLIVGIALGIAMDRLIIKWAKKRAIKNLKEQINSLKIIATITPDNAERARSIEAAAKLGEKLNQLEKEG